MMQVPRNLLYECLFWSWRFFHDADPPPKVVKIEGSFLVVNHPLLSHVKKYPMFVRHSFEQYSKTLLVDDL